MWFTILFIASSPKRRSRRGRRGKHHGKEHHDPLLSSSSSSSLFRPFVVVTDDHVNSEETMKNQGTTTINTSSTEYYPQPTETTNDNHNHTPYQSFELSYDPCISNGAGAVLQQQAQYVMTPIGPCALVPPFVPNMYYTDTLNSTTNTNCNYYTPLNPSFSFSVPVSPFSPVYNPVLHNTYIPESSYGSVPCMDPFLPYSIPPPFSPDQLINYLPIAIKDALEKRKYKTKLCMFWLNSGGQSCPYNALCMYAHGTHELHRPDATPSSSSSSLAQVTLSTIQQVVQPTIIETIKFEPANHVATPSNLNMVTEPTNNVSNSVVNVGRCHEYLLTGTCTRNQCPFLHSSRNLLTNKSSYAYRTDHNIHQDRISYGHHRTLSLPVFRNPVVNTVVDNHPFHTSPSVVVSTSTNDETNTIVGGPIRPINATIHPVKFLRRSRAHNRSQTMVSLKRNGFRNENMNTSTTNSISVK